MDGCILTVRYRVAKSVFQDFYRTHLARHTKIADSEERFRELGGEMSLFAHGLSAGHGFTALSTMIILLGFVLKLFVNRTYTSNVWLFVISVEISVVLISMYWFDKQYWKMVTDTASAFKDTEAYYHELSKVTNRIYEPFPIRGVGTNKLVHYPTLTVSVFVLLMVHEFSLIVAVWGVSTYSVFWWYFTVVCAYFSFTGTLIAWTLVIALYFLGYDIIENDSLEISLDIFQYVEQLGLKSFSSFLITGVLISTTNLILLTAILLVSGGIAEYSLFILLQALVSLVPFFMYQWGFHKIILEEKHNILSDIRIPHDDDIFDDDGNRIEVRDVEYMRLLIEFKREVERAPEWPSNVGLVARVVVLALSPSMLNLVFILAGLPN